MKRLLVLLLFLILLTGCTSTSTSTYSMYYMDTYITVKLYDISNSDEVFNTIDNIYKEYDKLCDRYTYYEDVINVYYLNNILDNNTSINIDSKLYEILEYGINAYNLTDGYVNIAIGNVIDIWKSNLNKNNIPSIDELSSANININDIVLDNNTYTKYNNISLDLGSYAKGYVTEVVSEYLKNNNIKKYLINAGGNVVVGSKYKSDKYKVGLETPFDTSNVYKVLNVENNSIVTSGSYQRYTEIDGVIYNHIINPKTLYPSNNTKSVTVITNNSAYADIMSTYLFMLSIEDGKNLVNSLNNVDAIWYNDTIYTSDGFSKYE